MGLIFSFCVWFFKSPLFFLLWWWSGGAQGRLQFSQGWNRRWYWSWLRSGSSNKQKLYLLTAEIHQHKIPKPWKELVTFVNQFMLVHKIFICLFYQKVKVILNFIPETFGWCHIPLLPFYGILIREQIKLHTVHLH